MSQLCCVSCGKLTLSQLERTHTVSDSAGRHWMFEMHHYCGPIVLRKDGQPKTQQPGNRSPFWPAYEAWRKDRE